MSEEVIAIKVTCPICKQEFFEPTKKYIPDIAALLRVARAAKVVYSWIEIDPIPNPDAQEELLEALKDVEHLL